MNTPKQKVQRRCTVCRETGHNRRKCPKLNITASTESAFGTVIDISASMDIYYEDLVYVKKVYKECAICLEPMKPSQENVINKTVCGHYFHQLCLWSWLVNKPECPWCRTIIGINELTCVDHVPHKNSVEK